MVTAEFFVGIDEAGRGPIAGPVAVGAFCVEKNARKKLSKFFPGGKIRDSKKLSPVAREKIFQELVRQKRNGAISFAVSFGSATEIDRKGITFAIRKALARSVNILGVKPNKCSVLLDGSLKAPEKFINQRTIIKGDEKEAVIALASIVAKVSRDRIMINFAKKYPDYGFEIHKGYGTKKHYQALKVLGFSRIHRRSFLKNVGK